MRAEHRRRIYYRRRRQVQRQIILISWSVLLVVGAVGLFLCRKDLTGTVAQRVVKSGSQKDAKQVKQITIEAENKAENKAERLKRVKKDAIEKGYPDDIIELLDKNEETVEFVENYEEKKDLPCAETLGDDWEEGKIPRLYQWDERWGYAPYGTSIVAVSGCGPTCMAMVAAGLAGDSSITPAKVAAYGTANGYVDESNDTYWRFMSEAGANWNLSCYDGMLTEEQVKTELQAGHPIICSVGPGDFTQIGHFIVLTRYMEGMVRVNDPFSQKNSDKEWVFAEIQDQIKAMWVFSVNQ